MRQKKIMSINIYINCVVYWQLNAIIKQLNLFHQQILMMMIILSFDSYGQFDNYCDTNSIDLDGTVSSALSQAKTECNKIHSTIHC